MLTPSLPVAAAGASDDDEDAEEYDGGLRETDTVRAAPQCTAAVINAINSDR